MQLHHDAFLRILFCQKRIYISQKSVAITIVHTLACKQSFKCSVCAFLVGNALGEALYAHVCKLAASCRKVAQSLDYRLFKAIQTVHLSAACHRQPFYIKFVVFIFYQYQIVDSERRWQYTLRLPSELVFSAKAFETK